jgi:hypothetical protein
MAFPQDPLDISIQVDLDGVWTDVPSFVYDRDAIQIDRGRPDEATRLDRSKCRLTLNNRDGRFSPRNPLSPYYGVLGRNTPLRVAVSGIPYLSQPVGANQPCIGISDSAQVSITGDIDIRVEMAMEDVSPVSGFPLLGLASQYSTVSNQRAWFFAVTSTGALQFTWSPTGLSGSTLDRISTAPAPTGPGRRAYRVTLDVDNGASGHTVTFYTAPGNDGPWTQLGDPVTTAGTTSIFNSSASLLAGLANTVGSRANIGRLYKFELRSGIDGTVVANADCTIQTPGVATFFDTAPVPNEWFVLNAEITDRNPRFTGEVASWPQRWDVSGQDVYVPLEATGILRRLGQGAPALRSAMMRGFSDPTRTAIVEYWPCEDAAGATFIASAFPGHSAGVPGGAPGFAGYSDFVGSDPLPTMAAGSMNFSVGPYTVTGETSLRAFAVLSPDGAGVTTRLVSMRTSGTAARWEIEINDTGSSFRLRAYSVTNASLLTTGFTGFTEGEQHVYNLELTQNGADVDYRLLAFRIQQSSLETATSVQLSGTLAAQTVNRVTSINVAPGGTLGPDSAAGHVILANDISAFANSNGPLVGWVGEEAADRIARLCAEEDISFARLGFADTVRMGVQTPQPLLTLLQECVESDGGIMFEPRDRLGLGYRDKTTLYNQEPQLALNYDAGDVAPPLEPDEDDQQVRNDITVTRAGGSSYRATLETGALSIQAPPNGIGRYDDAVTQSLRLDAQLVDAASWKLHVGTVDEARYPAINIDLASDSFANDAELTERALMLEQGDRITIDDLPAWMPPDQASQLMQGYSETLHHTAEWTITCNCSPESPYRVAVLNDAVLGHADTAGSALASGVTSTATSLSVATTEGPIWTTDSGDLPFDIAIGGERITVTAISGSSSPQTFTVTRSGNGVVKAHSAGADVRLWQPMILAY